MKRSELHDGALVQMTAESTPHHNYGSLNVFVRLLINYSLPFVGFQIYCRATVPRVPKPASMNQLRNLLP